MSINTAHANNGVLIHAGESILLFSENVTMDFSGQDSQLFKGTKLGKIYLTTHRMIFNSKAASDPLQSFSFPFICLSDVEIEQPVFGANYIKGKVRAQENGQFTGEAKFKLIFKSGGAIDFAQAALKAAYIAKKYGGQGPPPPYMPPTGSWYEAPPPAYSANPQGYYGWVPNTQAFPNGPPPNTVFMSDNPPPYPGITGGVTPNGYPGVPPSYPGGFSQPPQMNANWQQPNGPSMGYPSGPAGGGYPGGPPPTSGYPGGPPPSSGYPGGPPPTSGYPGGQPPTSGYPAGAAGGGGYPAWGNPSYQQEGGGYPQPGAGAAGYPNLPSAGMAFGGPSAPGQNTKEAEAAQSAYYDPNQPQTAYVPPPAYYDPPPPSYGSLSNKKQN